MKKLFTLSALLVLSACGVKEAQRPAMGEKLLAYAPENSNVLVYTNVRSVVESNIIKDEIDENLAKISEDAKKEYDLFVQLTGLDLRNDLDEMLIAGHPNTGDEKDMIVAIDAKFDEAKIIAAAKAKAAEENVTLEIASEKLHGATLYSITGKADEDSEEMKEPMFVAVKETVLLFGKKEAISKALSQEKSVLNNASFMAKVDEVKSNHFYAVLDAKEFKKNVQSENPYARTVEFIDNVALAMSFDESVHLQLLSNCLEATQAEEVENIVRGMLGIVRLGLSQERELIDLMNEVKIERENKQVRVKLNVDRKRLEMLKNYKPSEKLNKQI